MKNNKKNQRNFKNGVINHLLTKIPTISSSDKVGEIVKLIRKRSDWDTINYIYVLGEDKKLIGVVSIKELLRAKDTTVVGKIMIRNPAGVSASVKQEEAAVEAIHHNIKSVPILKTGTREFLGVVGTDKILNILHDEHVEDFLQFSGISKKHPITDTFKASPIKLVRLRFPWLFLGLFGGMISAYLVSQFQPILQQEIALAFFMPVVIYIANAVSTQTQALLIRLLASRKVETLLFLKKELAVSFILAVMSGIIISIYAGIWLQSINIALVVGLAILFSTVTAVLVGISIPSILYASKKDPALGSGPFATAIQDITTILIYFLIASLIIF